MSKLWINHNIKFDQGFLRREGMPLQGRLWCTHVMARVEWNDHMRYSLDACGERIGIAKSGEVKEYLDGHGLFEMVQMPDKKKRFKNYYFAKVPLSIIAPYCEQDVRVAWKLYQHQKPMAAEETGTLLKPLANVIRLEQQTTRVLEKMEWDGIRVDREYCLQASGHWRKKILAAEILFQQQTHTPLVDSAKELGKVFAQFGLSPGKTEKGNDSFTDAILEKLDHPVARLVQEHRDAKKRLGTYFSSFLYYSQWDGRAHCKFNQAGAATARFSSSEFNAQNLTDDEDNPDELFPVRKAFVTDPGGLLASMDYKAMEYFFLLDQAAQLMGRETPLLRRVKAGMDVHEATVLTVKESAGIGITRFQAKTTNFLTVYGGGDAVLASKLGCTIPEARRIRDAIFQAAPEILFIMAAIKGKAESRRFIYNWLGRRYQFPDRNLVYKAPNYWDQGGCADIMRTALVSVSELLRRLGARTKILLTIHDEIVLWNPDEERSLIPGIKQLMIDAYPAEYLPMDVSVCLGENLHEMREYEPEARDEVRQTS